MILPTLLFVLICETISVAAIALPRGRPLLADAASLSQYAPIIGTCPSKALVRPASGISSSESTYITNRKAVASTALKNWLASTGAGFSTSTKSYPTLGMTTSGGGYRALLCGAGVHQAFDARDSAVSTSGLYQAMTYEAGLSGGAWLLSSISANNWPTISSLKTGLWEQAFQSSLALPDNLLASAAYQFITADIVAKQAAGFPPTLTDPWGRLLSYQLLYGQDGGVADTTSGLASLSNFTSYNVPYPIFTSLGVDTADGQCLPPLNATQYEFSPYEFGSWDNGVAAFVQTQYLGTPLSAGQPSTPGVCVTNYDNQGYILGTSSSLFNEGCASTPSNPDTAPPSPSLVATLSGIVTKAHTTTTRDEYATYPNPFLHYASSPRVSGAAELALVDGGEADQNNPIWPMLHRAVDVLIVNDNSADTPMTGAAAAPNFPNGSEILNTYVQARSAGLTRMPAIPAVDVFVAKGLNRRPTFFGCNETGAMTVVYLPNVNYTFPSNEPTAKLEYLVSETDGMIANGVLIGTYNNNATWATCLGCAIMKKTGTKLPGGCGVCFDEFCYN